MQDVIQKTSLAYQGISRDIRDSTSLLRELTSTIMAYAGLELLLFEEFYLRYVFKDRSKSTLELFRELEQNKATYPPCYQLLSTLGSIGGVRNTARMIFEDSCIREPKPCCLRFNCLWWTVGCLCDYPLTNLGS